MNGERGFMFIWAMLLVVLVGTTSSVLFLRSNTLLAESGTDRIRSQSFWAAEGGLADARHALATDPEYTGGTIGVGPFRAISTVTRTENGWHVEVHATPGGVRIDADLVPGKELPGITRWHRR